MCQNFGFVLRHKPSRNAVGTIEQITSTYLVCGICLLNRNSSQSLLCNHLFKNAGSSHVDLVSETGVGRRVHAWSRTLVWKTDLSGQWALPDPCLSVKKEGVLRIVVKHRTVCVGFVSVHTCWAFALPGNQGGNKLVSPGLKKSLRFGVLRKGKQDN